MYGELRNIFDLAMVAAIIQKDGLADKVQWKPTVLTSGEKLRVPQGNVPREVETVINHRVVNQRTILAGVSGGVMVAPSDVLASVAKSDSRPRAWSGRHRRRRISPLKRGGGMGRTRLRNNCDRARFRTPFFDP